ncbi:SdrD B-like domain-containing protein, partial [Mammaliicoccus stepanovicii]|uniref:SdrD B-like domain-containing protein n=1 Tax=Mammaliicoccus stepanovicii TaxID=643214 RepID=UPI000CD3939A
MNKRVRQSFSIRKYSVGTGSILLGVFLAFSADNVVKAEEQSSTTTEETIRAQEKDIEMTNGKLQSEEITPEKASTEEQPKEATPEEASTEEQPKEATPEEASTEEQLKEATPEEASTEEQPKEATPEKASTEEQPKEATPEEASTEEQPKEATPEEASTEEQPKEATSEEASTEEQPKEATPEEALNSSSNLKVDNINSLQSSKEKENMLLNHYTSETGLTAEEVKSNLDSLNLDYSNLDMKEIDQAILKAVSEKREKEKMLATPVSTTPANRSVEPDKLLTRNKRMANTLLAPNQALKNINITLGDLGHYDFNGNLIPSSVNDHKVYPTDGEAISINVSFNVDNSAKSGDTFTLKHSENMTTDDLPAPNEVYKPIDIVDRSGEVIATGSYDETTKETTYTFTDYVDRYENVKAVLHLEHYIDRNVVLNNTNSIPVTFTIGDTTVTENYSVTYLDPEVNGPANIQTTYTSFDPETGRLEQIGYINPKALNAYNTTIRVGRNGSNSSAVIDRNTLIEVYKVPNRDMLPGSMKIQDFSALTKINPQISYYSNNTAEFRLGNISDVYVVRVVSYIDKTKTGPASQRITMDAADNTGSYYNAYYSNMIVKNSDTADGSGNEIPKRYKIGDYVWLDTNKDGIQNEANTGVPNVLVTITYPDGSTKGVRTDANGHYEFGGLLDGEKYKINFEVPDGYKITNSNAGTDNNLDSNGTDIDVQINGADDMSLDLGLVQTVYNVGDKVWEDTNKDGIQDDNEPGIKDVTVTLT